MKDQKTPVSVGEARLRQLFDPGTMSELGAYICRPGQKEEREGVVCGYGAVDGRLVFAFSQDAAAMKGALDARHVQKIVAVYEKAMAVGAPVVGLFDSAGAVVFDGADALSAYGELLRVVSDASGVVPQIAVLCGTCAGSMAAVAALFDFTVAVSGKTQLYVTSPSLLDGKNGSAEYAYENGNAEILAADEADAIAKTKTLLTYLPDNTDSGAPETVENDDPNRALALPERTTAAAALDAAVDTGSFFPLFDGVKTETRVGFARFGGVTAAVLSADGELTPAAADKMTAMVRFADAFGLPVVTLLNLTGTAADAAAEPHMAAALGRLAYTLAESDSAKVTAVVGAAVGAGFIFGAPKSLGADVVLALPGAEIGVLSARAGVAFLWNDRITPEVSREALEAEWLTTRATAENAAMTGAVDDIVAPAELRARLIAALYMLDGSGN